jgi:long-chain acyl-CoA synthetase
MDELLHSLVSAGSPFELQELNRAGRIFRHAPTTLRDLYARQRKRAQETPILVCDGSRYTLAKLFTTAAVIGVECRNQCKSGVERPRIAIVLPNGLEFAASLVSITDSGSIAVLVPYDTDLSRMSLCITQADCHLVITTADICDALAKEVHCPVMALKEGMWMDAEAAPSVEVDISPDAEAIIAFTSGSSGHPKAAVISHRALITGLWNMMLAGAWTSKRNRKLEDAGPATRPAGGSLCSLLASPMSHVSGYTHFLLSLAMSSRVAMLPSWNATTAANLACREDAKTLVGATPRMILDLLEVPLAPGQALPIESFGIHGAALRRGIVDEIRNRVPAARFSTGYGLTETCGSIASTAGAELLSLVDTCGPVLPTVEIQIIDQEGRERLRGQPGEICVRGAMLFEGYYQRAAPSLRRSISDWFPTGDIGILDAQGFLTLLERGSDTINAGPQGLYCSDIEKYLDNARWGDEVVAVGGRDGHHLLVGIESKRSNLDLGELERELEQVFLLKRESITIVCRSELPRTSSGKVDRRALAQLIPE